MAHFVPRPGDPCPCESGLAHEMCDCEEDWVALWLFDESKLPLPQPWDRPAEHHTWQIDLVPCIRLLPIYPDGRPVLSFLTSGPWLLAVSVHEAASAEPEEAATLLAETVRASVEWYEHVPSRIEVRHEPVVEHLQPRLADLDIEVAYRWLLPELHRLAEDLVWPGDPSVLVPWLQSTTSSTLSWAGWGISEPTLEALFDAVAEYRAARPWQALDDETPVLVSRPGGPEWSASVVGARSGTPGLCLFKDPADHDNVYGTGGLSDRPGRIMDGALFLALRDDREPVTPKAKEEAAGRWPLPGGLWPILTTINTLAGGVTERDMQVMTVTLRAIARACRALSREWAANRYYEWEGPEDGTRLRLPTRFPTFRRPTDPRVTPRYDQIERLLDERAAVEVLLGNEDPTTLFHAAKQVLCRYARSDPEDFLTSHEAEVLAAAVHSAAKAAQQPSIVPERSLAELAEFWGVSRSAIGRRSRTIRERTPRPLCFWDLLRMESETEIDGWDDLMERGVDPGGILDALRFPSPDPPFDPARLVESAGLGSSDLRSLCTALRRGLTRWDAESGPRRAIEPTLVRGLADADAFGAGLREALKSRDVSPDASRALAVWVVARVAGCRRYHQPGVPTSSLLALSFLAERGVLRGPALKSAFLLSLAIAPHPAQGLEAEDVRPLIRAITESEELDARDRRRLLEELQWEADGEPDGLAPGELAALVAEALDHLPREPEEPEPSRVP